MNFQKYIERISFLDYMIRSRITGNSRDLAQKLEVSERTVFYYLTEMKSLGAPISWSEYENSYVYSDSVIFVGGFFPENSAILSSTPLTQYQDQIYPGRQESFINN